MNRLAILFLALLTSLPLQADNIPYIESSIKADGLLDEAVWETIVPFRNFQNFFPIDKGPARFDTEVRVFQDGKYLNIAFVYFDSLAEVRVNSLKRDDYTSGFHLSDGVGVVIDPYSNQNRGYLFAVNGKGAQLDALIANFDNENLSWDAVWESGQSVQGTKKIYELKIPLSSFSYDEDIIHWSFQFYTRDAKDRMYTVWNKFERGFLQFDTRFLKSLPIENLQPAKTAKAMLIPSLTSNYQKEVESGEDDLQIVPSLDVQYKITDGLRLDATLHPDFSQIDVDQQVTNLTRFNIVFPERRNFFVENSDMFTTLGLAGNINPFYSRFIGASQDILLGLKLSGNVSPNTRIGLLNVQSEKGNGEAAQNYTVAVAKQQWNKIFNTTGYWINRQQTDGLAFRNEFNRVAGLKMNYLSPNRKWSGFATYSQSFNEELAGEGQAFSVENNYQTRTLSFSTKLSSVGKNYLTDIGFVPRIYNYDALNETVVREGYTQFSQSVFLNYFPKNQKVIQTIRLANASVDAYWDEEGEHFETNAFYNTALFFSNQMSAYVNLYHDDIALKYAFSPLRNDQLILPGAYQNSAIRMGFNSDYTRRMYGSVNFQTGTFYGGDRQRFGAKAGYRFLPLLSLEMNYEYNTLSFEDLGQQNLHLFGLRAEIFFSNKLNWTTYIQYNEQIDNFNINSRLQWEYKPLSFVYLVFADNYTEDFRHKNWGISLKVNRRLTF
ncbi:MAG: DUF5916 domain-containing protein [Bacteroidota bacterium]